MKIVITGASGYVGQNIIPFLSGRCDTLLLVGRDAVKLAETYPSIPSCTFEEMPAYAQNFDILVHLSVLNTNAFGNDSNFHDINVTLALQTAKAAAKCGIKKFYNISSIHVLDNQNQSPYAKSKREAAHSLADVTGIEVINVYLPYVRGAQWNGKLAFLNSTPLFLAKPLQACFLALKPSVSASLLAQFVLKPSNHQDLVILSEGQSHNSAYKLMKRAMDLLFAIAVIALLWWVLLIVGAIVRMGSSGPAIFAQSRVGLHGKIFTCYKFRTMQVGTVQAGTHEVSRASVTPIGHFLRRTKLDELPQVWNILRNEISLIGPRPGLPGQTELFDARESRGIFCVKPGISGLAQINNIDMSDPRELAKWDARYIALQSLILDFKIIISTVKGGGQGDKTAK